MLSVRHPHVAVRMRTLDRLAIRDVAQMRPLEGFLEAIAAAEGLRAAVIGQF